VTSAVLTEIKPHHLLAVFPRVSAAADPAVPVTPFLDCVRFNGDQANPIYTAYFGYSNNGPVRFTFPVGDDTGPIRRGLHHTSQLGTERRDRDGQRELTRLYVRGHHRRLTRDE
jgi:hypothetical protein